MSDSRSARGLCIVVLAAVLAMCGACSVAAGATHSARPSAAASAPAGVGIEVLDDAVPATGAEFTVGARFNGTIKASESSSAATCMARSGFHLAHVSAGTAAAEDFDNAEFPDLATIARNRMFGPAGPVAPPPGPVGQASGYNSAFMRCAAAADKPFAALTNAIGSLESPWMNIVATIESSAPVGAKLAGFRSCIEQAGAPAANVSAPSSADAFGGFLAWQTGIQTHEKTQAGTQALQRQWAPVFVRCAEPTVAELETLQSQQRPGFLRQHAQQVQEVQQLARAAPAGTTQ